MFQGVTLLFEVKAMPFIPPEHSDFIYKVERLVNDYQGQNENRHKLVSLLNAFTRLYPSTNHMIAALIFAAEKIDSEYTYIGPKTRSYILIETGSTLYTAIEKVLNINSRNCLSDNTRLVFLTNLLIFLPRESQLDLENTEYTNVRMLCKDLEQVIAKILQRSHPELLEAVEAKSESASISSYLAYIPQSIGGLVTNQFFSAPAAEPINDECRCALLSLPNTIIPLAKKVGVLEALPNEIKLEQKLSPANS
jgi:hypothetical protein